MHSWEVISSIYNWNRWPEMYSRDMGTYMNSWNMGWDIYNWNMWSNMDCRHVRSNMNWRIVWTNVNGWSVRSYIYCVGEWMPPKPLTFNFLWKNVTLGPPCMFVRFTFVFFRVIVTILTGSRNIVVVYFLKNFNQWPQEFS